MCWQILYANLLQNLTKDAVIQDEIWQEYNTVSMTNNTFREMPVHYLHSISQVFVFKKTAVFQND